MQHIDNNFHNEEHEHDDGNTSASPAHYTSSSSLLDGEWSACGKKRKESGYCCLIMTLTARSNGGAHVALSRQFRSGP